MGHPGGYTAAGIAIEISREFHVHLYRLVRGVIASKLLMQQDAQQALEATQDPSRTSVHLGGQ